MRIICFNSHLSKKKQRGQKRKLKSFERYLTDQTQSLNLEITSDNRNFDHWHMPSNQSFLNSKKTYGKVKTQVMRIVLERAADLDALAKKENQDIKIVVLFTYPDLWDSEIMAFFDARENEYYKWFFNERTKTEEMILQSKKSLCKDRGLTLPEGFSEKIYLWQVFNEETEQYEFQTMAYFYGDFDD